MVAEKSIRLKEAMIEKSFSILSLTLWKMTKTKTCFSWTGFFTDRILNCDIIHVDSNSNTQPCFGPSCWDSCPQTLHHPAQTQSPLPGPPLSTMAPLWSSTSSHNVGLSTTTVHRATPPFNPSTRKWLRDKRPKQVSFCDPGIEIMKAA